MISDSTLAVENRLKLLGQVGVPGAGEVGAEQRSQQLKVKRKAPLIQQRIINR